MSASVPCFLIHNNSALLGTGTQPIPQGLRLSLAVTIYEKKEKEIAELLRFLLQESYEPVIVTTWGRSCSMKGMGQ